jgi:hypothetical protein
MNLRTIITAETEDFTGILKSECFRKGEPQARFLMYVNFEIPLKSDDECLN